MRSNQSTIFANRQIAILGGGVIGLSIAWKLAQHGYRITLIDREKLGQGASWAAAGMLAPAFEAADGSETHAFLFDLCMASNQLWPEWVAKIEAISRQDVGYSSGPTLALAREPADISHLKRVQVKLEAHALDSALLNSSDMAEIDPNINSRGWVGLKLNTDGQIDNRRLVLALIGICQAHSNIEIVENSAEPDLATLSDQFDQVIIATGAKSANLIPDIPIIPVKGELLSVLPAPSMPTQTVRNGSFYIAPKADRIIIGATVERGRDDLNLQTASASNLLAQAAALYPVFKQCDVQEHWAGVRPGTADHGPIITRLDSKIILATGHYRNGVLLSPKTAELVLKLVEGQQLTDTESAFDIERFVTSGIVS